MLCYVHQLVASNVRLQFGAGQVTSNWFLQLFWWKQMSEEAKKYAEGGNESEQKW